MLPKVDFGKGYIVLDRALGHTNGHGGTGGADIINWVLSAAIFFRLIYIL